MKKYFTLFLFWSVFLSSNAQTCDSVIVRLTQINGWSFVPWINEYLDIDSFANGKLKSHHQQDWDYFLLPDRWYHPNFADFFTYDSLDRLVEKQKLYIWSNNHYNTGSRETYEYDSLSRITALENYDWTGTAWQRQSYDARIEHIYNGSSRDSVITEYSWNGSNFVPANKTEFICGINGKDSVIYFNNWTGVSFDSTSSRRLFYDGIDSLIRVEYYGYDAGSWNPTSLSLISYTPSGSDILVTDSNFYNQFNFWLWNSTGYTTYNADGYVISSDSENSENFAVWAASYSYTCNGQISGFSGHSHGGSGMDYAMSYGHYTYNNDCHPIEKWWHAEDNGTYNDDHQTLYSYTGCNSIAAILPTAMYVCKGDSILIDLEFFGGTPPYSFNWTPAAGLSSDIIAEPMAAPLAGTTYTVTITDSNGITATQSVGITVDSVPVANITIGTIDTLSPCNTVVLISDPGNYDQSRWYYNGLQIQATNGSSSQITVNRNGTYVLRVNEFSGCPGYDTVEVNMLLHSGPEAVIEKGCNQLFAISATAEQYLWKRDNTSAGTNDTLNITENYGNYIVYVTDSNGCQNFSRNLYFTEYRLTLSTPASTCPDSCNADMNASAYGGTQPYSWSWSNGDTTSRIENVCIGMYTVTVVDSAGCTLTETGAVWYYTFPTHNKTASAVFDSTDCTGVAFIALSNGNPSNFIYTWGSGTTGFIDSNLCAGWHYVTIRNGDFCTKLDSVQVEVNTAIPPCSASVATTDGVCHLACEGGLEIFDPVGTPPFAYQWIYPTSLQNSHSTSFTYGLCPGNYSCIMIDGAGCIDTITATINNPPPLIASFEVLSVNQNNPCSTLVEVNFQNAPPWFGMDWSGGAWASDSTRYLCPGEITVTVILGTCTLSFDYDVPDSITACATLPDIDNPSIYLACDGAITLYPNGTPPFHVQWTSGDTTVQLTNLCEGTYYYSVTDSTGCTVSDSVVVEQPPPVCEMLILTTPISCAGACDGILVGAALAGIPPFQYNWSNGATTDSITSLCADTFSLVMTDSVGCIDTVFAILTDPPPLTLTVQAIPTTCTGCNDGQINSNVTNGNPPYVFTVSPGNLTCQFCSNLQPGIYTVCVMDANGCDTCMTDTVFDDPTKIRELISGIKWSASVHPNPAHEYLDITLTYAGSECEFSMQLFDASGKIVHQEIIGLQYKLATGHLSRGIYLLKLSKADEGYVSGKIVLE